jgi:NAD(P)-dependent dehydrogenase (short-subunit alcohol dehydrogenase family)
VNLGGDAATWPSCHGALPSPAASTKVWSSVMTPSSPQLARSRGAVVNVLSLASLASVPGMAAYSASKAAALAVTQALRLQLAAEGVRVHAVLAGPVDTDMSRGLDIPKAALAAVAEAILDGVAAGDDEIFPVPLPATVAEGWPSGPVKLLERGNAELAASLRQARPQADCCVVPSASTSLNVRTKWPELARLLAWWAKAL